MKKHWYYRKLDKLEEEKLEKVKAERKQKSRALAEAMSWIWNKN